MEAPKIWVFLISTRIGHFWSRSDADWSSPRSAIRGINAGRMQRFLTRALSTSIPRTAVKDLLATAPGADASVSGWVKSVRRQKNVSFITLNDGSSFQSLQVVCDGGDDLAKVTVGSSIRAVGRVTAAPKSGQVEIHASDVHVYGTSDASTYPLSKKYHTLEFVREHLHLRPRTNTFGAVTRVRNALRSLLEL